MPEDGEIEPCSGAFVAHQHVDLGGGEGMAADLAKLGGSLVEGGLGMVCRVLLEEGSGIGDLGIDEFMGEVKPCAGIEESSGLLDAWSGIVFPRRAKAGAHSPFPVEQGGWNAEGAKAFKGFVSDLDAVVNDDLSNHSGRNPPNSTTCGAEGKVRGIGSELGVY